MKHILFWVPVRVICEIALLLNFKIQLLSETQLSFFLRRIVSFFSPGMIWGSSQDFFEWNYCKHFDRLIAQWLDRPIAPLPDRFVARSHDRTLDRLIARSLVRLRDRLIARSLDGWIA